MQANAFPDFARSLQTAIDANPGWHVVHMMHSFCPGNALAGTTAMCLCVFETTDPTALAWAGGIGETQSIG